MVWYLCGVQKVMGKLNPVGRNQTSLQSVYATDRATAFFVYLFTLDIFLVILFQNGNPQNPMCEGIDGVTAAYYHSIQRVQLYGN